MRPARCAIATQITKPVAAMAAPVPQRMSVSCAPRAGSLPSAANAQVGRSSAARALLAKITARVLPLLISRLRLSACQVPARNRGFQDDCYTDWWNIKPCSRLGYSGEAEVRLASGPDGVVRDDQLARVVALLHFLE